MATLKVRKQPTGVATDLTGLKTTRYERLRVAHGVILNGTYAIGDSIQFPELDAKSIVRATVVVHSGTPTIANVYPGTDITNGVVAITPNNTNKISYIIEYVKGIGTQSGLPFTIKPQVS